MQAEIGPCRPTELPQLQELANRVFRPEGGDMAREYPLLLSPENAEHLRVARVDGRIVAHAGLCLREVSLMGARVRVVSVGAVCTDPAYRGHGLASLLMEDASAHARKCGVGLMLISGGRGLYRRLGYVRAGSFPCWRVPAAPPAAQTGLELRRGGPDDLPALARLYQAEPVRFCRPRRDWESVLGAGMLMNQPAELWLALRNGSAVAYAAVQRPRGAEAPVRVFEAAGDRSALPALAGAAAHSAGSASAEVVLGGAHAADRPAGMDRTEIPFPGTVGVTDPGLVLSAVAFLLRERAGETVHLLPEGRGAVLRAGGESVRLAGMDALTLLLFGAITEDAARLPPLPIGAQAALDNVLPLPLPWYGYNYV